ncbi:MAG: hypothetical protein Q8L54_04870 [Devosia sp.]|nr:hypothetical protein [Devosia sp.]
MQAGLVRTSLSPDRRTHDIAWVQSDNDRKFVDPHFVEVMAGALRGARAGLIGELIRQCEEGGPGKGHIIPSSFHVAPGMDARVLEEPLPGNRS